MKFAEHLVNALKHNGYSIIPTSQLDEVGQLQNQIANLNAALQRIERFANDSTMPMELAIRAIRNEAYAGLKPHPVTEKKSEPIPLGVHPFIHIAH